MRTQSFFRIAGLTLAFLGGCASLPEDYARTETSALDGYQSTSIGAKWTAAEAANPGKSGFRLVREGRHAFNMRVGMIDLAEKTIDVQVYIWEKDKTGRIFADRLIRAADRGVRVRVLVDDMGIGASDESIASMDAHPNIEIRIFNPFANRGAKMLDFLGDFQRVNHRMHNKIIVADNSLAVVGGRNVGDHYFGVEEHSNFRDLDIAAVGPVVRDISKVFDHFWGGDWAVPIEVLVGRKYTASDLETAKAKLRENIAADDYPYSIDRDQEALRAELVSIGDTLVWAPGQIVWDDPTELEQTGATSRLINAFRSRIQRVEKALTIESAYFVVGDRGVQTIKAMVDRGVEVRVLTNSLVSNDVLAAHAGHANYREDLVRVGAHVYELRPDSGIAQGDWKGESIAGLHTKALVFDGEAVFVGSFNLDPRSANINTEAGLYVESAELAARLLAYMDEGVLPENSYRLEFDGKGDLVWVTQDNGVEVRYDKDPLSTAGQRFTVGLIRILPFESQL